MILSSHEQYLFSLTSSAAHTPAAQRAAIAREGLNGLSRAEVLARQRANWRLTRAAAAKSDPTLPVWVLALRKRDRTGLHAVPAGTPTGAILQCAALRNLAFDRASWGRTRIRQDGYAGAYAGIRETDNGKSGWDRVITSRTADYLCVLAPSGLQIAYQITASSPLRVVPVWRGWFRGPEGQAMRLDRLAPARYTPTIRVRCRALQAAGFRAYLTRQSAAQIAAGSGERGRTGTLVLIVDFGRDGIYHGTADSTVAAVRRAQADRAKARDERELADLIDSGRADEVFVCRADSLRAGNCLPGTNAWIDQHHLAGTHLQARELRALANGSARFVRAAIVAAVRRERVEDARGYAILAEHVSQ